MSLRLIKYRRSIVQNGAYTIQLQTRESNGSVFLVLCENLRTGHHTSGLNYSVLTLDMTLGIAKIEHKTLGFNNSKKIAS